MLTQTKIKQLRTDLLREQEFLSKQLANAEAGSHDATQSESTGENSYDEDFPDLATATFEREKDLSIELNIRDLLEQVEDALHRIDVGTYGICAVCGREIAADRMEALPYTILCLEDKEREERTR